MNSHQNTASNSLPINQTVQMPANLPQPTLKNTYVVKEERTILKNNKNLIIVVVILIVAILVGAGVFYYANYVNLPTDKIEITVPTTEEQVQVQNTEENIQPVSNTEELTLNEDGNKTYVSGSFDLYFNYPAALLNPGLSNNVIKFENSPIVIDTNATNNSITGYIASALQTADAETINLYTLNTATKYDVFAFGTLSGKGVKIYIDSTIADATELQTYSDQIKIIAESLSLK